MVLGELPVGLDVEVAVEDELEGPTGGTVGRPPPVGEAVPVEDDGEGVSLLVLHRCDPALKGGPPKFSTATPDATTHRAIE